MTGEGKTCTVKQGIKCFVGVLVLIVLGTGIMAQWNAWSGYKVFSADEYSILLVLREGKIDVPKGHEVKVYKTASRVDVFTPDKTKREIYFNVEKIEIKPR